MRTQDVVGPVLDELVDYTISHFAFEESLQEECGYQHAKPHQAVHEMFVKRVAKFQEKHYAGEDVALQLHAMLSTWLAHLMERARVYLPLRPMDRVITSFMISLVPP